MFYRCHRYKHHFGTAFIVSGMARHLVMVFRPVSARVYILRINGKDIFYEALETTYDGCLRIDIKILLGIINAKKGKKIYMNHR